MIAAALSAVGQGYAPRPIESRAPAPVAATQAAPPAGQAGAFLIQRAPGLSFVYIQLDPATGAETWRWPRGASDAANPPLSAGALIDLAA